MYQYFSPLLLKAALWVDSSLSLHIRKGRLREVKTPVGDAQLVRVGAWGSYPGQMESEPLLCKP